MATLTLRSVVNRPLTHAEVDANFTSLNNALSGVSVNSITQGDSSVIITDTLNATGGKIELKTDNTTKFTVNANGALGLGATPDYGSQGQVLTSNTSTGAVTWATPVTNALNQGNSSVTVTDTGTDGKIALNTEGTDRLIVGSSGNVGIGVTPGATYKLEVNGSFAATSKSFVINHPTQPGKKLRYGSLEGPENGVYVRGKINGTAVIELPEYWSKLVDVDSITVNLTPIGKHQKLYVLDIRDNKVYVANDGLFAGEINCFYTVYGERVDVEKLVVEY